MSSYSDVVHVYDTLIQVIFLIYGLTGSRCKLDDRTLNEREWIIMEFGNGYCHISISIRKNNKEFKRSSSYTFRISLRTRV